MYTMNKNEIKMYVTTIHKAYPDAPKAAMDAMQERFAAIQLEDNFLAEAHKKMNTLDTAILINNLSRHHLSTELAFEVIKHFDDERVVSKIHSEWPDEQMEERIGIIAAWHTPFVQTENIPVLQKHKNSKTVLMSAFCRCFLKPAAFAKH